MAKMMLFIDGTWLPGALRRLQAGAGRTSLELDWARLPRVLAEAARSRLGVGDVEVVRAFAFAALPGAADAAGAGELLARLREEFHYEVELYAPAGGAAPEEGECPSPPAATTASVALAAAMLSYAAIPSACDVAVVLAGDAALAPALRRARGVGKRVVLASVRGACARELTGPREAAGLVDCATVWLDDLLARLELRFERDAEEEPPPPPRRIRESWEALAPRGFGARFPREERFAPGPRRGPWRSPGERPSSPPQREPGPEDAVGGFASGQIVKLVPEKQIGFLRTASGGDYYFNFAYLDPALDPGELREGMTVEGEIYRLPTDRAGAVRGVRRRVAGEEEPPPPELTEG